MNNYLLRIVHLILFVLASLILWLVRVSALSKARCKGSIVDLKRLYESVASSRLPLQPHLVQGGNQRLAANRFKSALARLMSVLVESEI